VSELLQYLGYTHEWSDANTAWRRYECLTDCSGTGAVRVVAHKPDQYRSSDVDENVPIKQQIHLNEQCQNADSTLFCCGSCVSQCLKNNGEAGIIWRKRNYKP
jgi:hypothetical protein